MTKSRRKKNDTPLHPSVEAIFAYYEKTGKVPSPTATKADVPLVVPRMFKAHELTMMLKKEFQRLFQEFGPTEAQIQSHRAVNKIDTGSEGPGLTALIAGSVNQRLGLGFVDGSSSGDEGNIASPPQKEKEDLDESGSPSKKLDLIGDENNQENQAAQEEEAKESSISNFCDKYSNKGGKVQIKRGLKGEKYTVDGAVDKLFDT